MASSSNNLFFFFILSITLLSLASSHMSKKDLSVFKASYLEKQKELNESKADHQTFVTELHNTIDNHSDFVQSIQDLVDWASVTGEFKPLEKSLEKKKAAMEEAKKYGKCQDAEIEIDFEEKEHQLQVLKNYIRILENIRSKL